MLFSLSAAETRRVSASARLRCRRYFSLRSRHGGLGSVSESVHPSTTLGHAFSKPAADFLQHRRAAAVLDYVMQQGGDGEILVASGFEHQRGHAHQVRDVGNCRGLAGLPGMLLRGELKRAQEAGAELDRALRRARIPRSGAGLQLHCFSPRRASRYARMNGCRSPSSTRSTSPTSVLVR